MPRTRRLRLAIVTVLLGILLLPAHSALAASREQPRKDHDSPVHITNNPQVWAIYWFAQLKLAISPASALLPVNPKPVAGPKPVINPKPDPDPPPAPFGPGGGGCPTCGGGGGGGGETGPGSDPDGG